MSQFDKAWEKFVRIPIPKDITFEELTFIVNHFGFEIQNDGKHVKVRHRQANIRIPIPIHGKTVGPAYIKQVKEAISSIKET